MGPRKCEGCAVLSKENAVLGMPKRKCGGRGNACGLGHWGLRWNSLWGYETLYWVCWNGHAVGGETHVDLATGAFGGAPYGAMKRCTGRAGMDMARVGPVTGAFGGAPYGATKRCAGRAERDMRWAAETHMNPVTGAFGGAPYGATKRSTGRSSIWCYEPCEGLV